MRSLNPDQLRAFLDVVECASFSAAARRLNLSQPAVSLQIRELEQRPAASRSAATGACGQSTTDSFVPLPCSAIADLQMGRRSRKSPRGFAVTSPFQTRAGCPRERLHLPRELPNETLCLGLGGPPPREFLRSLL